MKDLPGQDVELTSGMNLVLKVVYIVFKKFGNNWGNAYDPLIFFKEDFKFFSIDLVHPFMDFVFARMLKANIWVI